MNKLIKITSYISLGSVALMSNYQQVKAAKKPNIVLIIADDMGYECLEANGSTYNTPYLDQLAEEGILFQNCHSQPLSTPSRVQLIITK